MAGEGGAAGDEQVVGIAAHQAVAAGAADENRPAAAPVDVVVTAPAVDQHRLGDVAGDVDVVVAVASHDDDPLERTADHVHERFGTG